MLSRSITRSATRGALRCQCRAYATGTSTTPPILLKIRKDLKSAMQAKDTNRLTVLRSLLSQTLNASKTSNPINTDMQMLALLRKTKASSEAAVSDFEKAGRSDLVEKEQKQIAVLEEYVGGVEVMGEEEIKAGVESVVAAMTGELKMGDVLKEVFKEGGPIEGKNADRGVVARVVKEVLAAKKE
ncbi:Yqey-like protein-domain-containing protein [Tricladium varicosporioides]|nr:Yqey-like protein-domain-containing protein [Hymenoscyphus varicosporioides]